MDLKRFGRRVNMLRKQRRITSEYLAEMCGVSAVHIRQVEGGTRQPSFELFVRLCDALQISPNYLLQDLLPPDGSAQFPNALWHNLSPAEQALVEEIARTVHDRWQQH